MNYNEEVPDFLGELGDMLPADVLKKLNQLLEMLHQTEGDKKGSTVFIYAPGSQYVDKQFIFDKATWKHPAPPDQKSELKIRNSQPPNCKFDGTNILPDVLATDKAMALWRKAQAAGWIDDNYQPLLSRTQAALLADAMSERLSIKEKWKVFETLWHRRNMHKDYYLAFGQQQTSDFQDELKELFG